jgi:hypothetical protein
MKFRSLTRMALALAVSGAGSFALLDAGIASADEVTCRGTIGARTIDGDVNVPRGASCTLRGTRVKGNVFVRDNARAELIRASLTGNVQAGGARNVIVRAGSRINGSVQVENGGAVSVLRSRVGGSVQTKSNNGLSRVVRNRVGADVQFFSNRGGFAVWYNRIDGNLQCKSNGLPRRGDHNIVQGNKEDQCRNR